MRARTETTAPVCGCSVTAGPEFICYHILSHNVIKTILLYLGFHLRAGGWVPRKSESTLEFSSAEISEIHAICGWHVRKETPKIG